MSKPISVQCNNPLNLRPGSPWEGLADPPFVDTKSGKFCNFISAPFGFRAPMKVYITKYDRGIRTIRQLITEWSPPDGEGNSQASTDAYIAAVCKAAGYKPDDEINLKSWPIASAICYGQTEFESGQPFEANWKMEDMAEGALRAGIVDAPKSVIKKLGVVLTGTASAAAAAAPSAIDAINTYRPVVDQANSATLKTIFTIAAVIFAALAIFNHVRAATK